MWFQNIQSGLNSRRVEQFNRREYIKYFEDLTVRPNAGIEPEGRF